MEKREWYQNIIVIDDNMFVHIGRNKEEFTDTFICLPKGKERNINEEEYLGKELFLKFYRKPRFYKYVDAYWKGNIITLCEYVPSQQDIKEEI